MAELKLCYGKCDRCTCFDIGAMVDKLAAYEDAKEQGRLVLLDTAAQDDHSGLKRKYIVFKSDTGEPVEDCFVLRPDKDPAAVVALEAYAKATDNQALAADIINWVGDSGRALVLPKYAEKGDQRPKCFRCFDDGGRICPGIYCSEDEDYPLLNCQKCYYSDYYNSEAALIAAGGQK